MSEQFREGGMGRGREGEVRLFSVLINGEVREIPVGMTLSALLVELGHKVPFCAVERNRELVPRGEHGACELREGDELEIVTLVGGG